MAKTEGSNPRFFKRYYRRTFVLIIILIILISIIGVALFLTGNPSSERTLLLATTTSTANSGLLDHILPDFEKQYDATVKVTPVGTGQALEMGRRGDVDVLMVHAPSQEEDFVDIGYGTARYPVCFNYFVLVGPPGNHAGIVDGDNSTEAMIKLYNSQSGFCFPGR